LNRPADTRSRPERGPEDLNRGEPNRDELGQGEPNQGEPNQGEPNQGEPNQGEPNQGEPNRAGLSQGEPNRDEPNRDEPNRDELGQETLDRICSGCAWLGRWLWVASTPSTQDLARSLAGQGSGASAGGHDPPRATVGRAPGILVLADEQTAGQGRMGRIWHSASGAGLWLSLVFSPARPRAEWPVLTSLTALAVRDSLQRVTGCEVGLKWPNDLYGRGRKLAGVLAQVEPGGQVILGVGLNVAHRDHDFPAALRGKAISARMLCGRPIGRAALLEAFLGRMERRLAAFERAGPESLHADLLAASLLVGRHVEIGPDRRMGWVAGLGPLGELLLRDEEGQVHAIVSGQVLRTDPPIEEG